jgi:phospholipase C
MKSRIIILYIVLLVFLVCFPAYAADESGIHKIKHVIIIMQENRSFDHYFGTYPGAEGIPMKDGMPDVCVPDPVTGQCVRPYHDTNDLNYGGAHGRTAALTAIDGGRMDGFIKVARRNKKPIRKSAPLPDVMGYHNRREIPNYWEYADEFVLQDHMFEPIGSWSQPSHLYMVSAWCAKCASEDPMSCHNAPAGQRPDNKTIYSWTDLTYLLHKNNINWAYYLDKGAPVDEGDPEENTPKKRRAGVPQIWNPLPSFVTVKEDNELDHVKPLSRFFAAAKRGDLPEVVWIVPNNKDSEHPVALVSDGQAFVTKIVNAIMNSPCWDSSAIFVTWDDWGGFYDHVVPPRVDENGYGLRVPGLLISPYAKKGYIDRQILSFDAYLKFIEDIFINEQRIDPKTDGRPDRRPTVRENVPMLGDLAQDFDFNQPPRQPLILDPRPK